MNYSVGYGAVNAMMVWNCAWGDKYLHDLETDPEAAAHSLDMYASVTERPEFRNSYDPVSMQPYVHEVIEQARLGDPSGIAYDQQVNCGYMLTW
ncbi:MAG: hypothetical protein FWE61_00755 [Micrococcales bacterium]|nr:hypothetical protein [Micrococcales bacterium]